MTDTLVLLGLSLLLLQGIRLGFSLVSLDGIPTRCGGLTVSDRVLRQTCPMNVDYPSLKLEEVNAFSAMICRLF